MLSLECGSSKVRFTQFIQTLPSFKNSADIRPNTFLHEMHGLVPAY